MDSKILTKFNLFKLRHIVYMRQLATDCLYPVLLYTKSGTYKVAYSYNDISSVIDFMNETSFVPTIYDHIQVDDKTFYVTDYKDGLTKLTLDAMTSERIYCQLVYKIQYLNQHGVYYDDLDCDNVLVDRFGELHIIDVGGFTLSKEEQKPIMTIEMEDYDEVVPLPL